MRRWETAGLLLVALVGAACGRPAPPDGTKPAGQTVIVAAREWAFDPAALEAKPGEVTFQVRNDGAVEHNFFIENVRRGGVEAIQPGQTRSLTVTVAAGEYTVICNLPGHREAGMVATFKVGE